MAGTVNVPRVILGGLVAGVLMNISEYVLNEIVLAEEMAALFAGMNLAPPTGSTIALFVLLTFALGIAAIWLYAMLRSHSGAGPGTAACTALFVWFFYAFLGNASFWALGMIGTGLTLTVMAWMLGEIVVGTIAGAYLYRE